jgi:acyl transferase domain-containing protein
LGDVIFENSLTTETPLLHEHVIYDAVIVPGAWHVSAFLEAAQEVFGPVPCAVSDVMMRQALAIPPDTPVTVQAIVTPGEDGEAKVQVFSQDGDSWKLHTAAGLRAATAGAVHFDVPAPPSEVISGDAFYVAMNTRGVDLGPAFSWVEQVWRRDGEALARMRLPVLRTARALTGCTPV